MIIQVAVEVAREIVENQLGGEIKALRKLSDGTWYVDFQIGESKLGFALNPKWVRELLK